MQFFGVGSFSTNRFLNETIEGSFESEPFALINDDRCQKGDWLLGILEVESVLPDSSM